jgi:cysteinyl-tRNA synthetase
MSCKYLGQPFDIHTGGIDLVFPHHENEIAQIEASNGKKFVNYWLHNEWMMISDKKMSKSLGNQYNLRDIEQMGYNPLALRYFYLTGHYRTQINFTFDNLKNSQNSLNRLKRIIETIKDDKNINKTYLKEFENAMDDDLNTPEALQILWKLIRDDDAIGKFRTIKKIDEVFGLDLLKKEKMIIPSEVKQLIDEREIARKEKNWNKADMLRNKIQELGFKLDDGNDGVRVSKV